MATEFMLTNVRPRGRATVDVHVAAGVIRWIGTGLEPPTGIEVIDGGGKLLFPGFVDAHAHMDKTLLGMGWYRNEVGPNLLDKIENERKIRRERGIVSYRQ